MKYKVEIINNPYTQNMRILLNGEAASVYGGIQQYQDEPFWNWCEEIFEAIHKECNYADYLLRYTGRTEEDAILNVLSQRYDFCEYLYVPYEKQETFQQKMKSLNELVVKEKLVHIRPKVLNTVFFVSRKYDKYKDLLLEMSIRNNYCNVISEVKRQNTGTEKTDMEDVIFVISDEIQIEEAWSKYNSRFVFGIQMGNQSGFINKKGRFFLYGSTEKELFTVIFECFKAAPLLFVFHQCVSEINEMAKSRDRLISVISDIQSIENPMTVKLEHQEIELGKSVSIQILKGNRRVMEGIDFVCSKPGILKCNGMYIEGIAEGDTNLYAFRKGENIPFYVKNLVVRKRNRIQSITVGESRVVMGVGDEYVPEYSYYPPNADNLNELKWTSSDGSIVRVSNKGKLKAIAQGTCQIYVMAEQVSAMLQCVVKPYMEKLEVVPDGQIELSVGDTCKLEIVYSPNDCIDNKVIITSENLQIANVSDNTVKGVDSGETRIIIENKGSGLKKFLGVSVKKKQEIKKKKGFFARLFQK